MSAPQDSAKINVRFVIEGDAEDLLPELQRLGAKGIRTAELRVNVPSGGTTWGEDYSLGIISMGAVRNAYQALKKLNNQARVTQDTDRRAGDLITKYGRLTGRQKPLDV